MKRPLGCALNIFLFQTIMKMFPCGKNEILSYLLSFNDVKPVVWLIKFEKSPTSSTLPAKPPQLAELN